MTFKLPSLKGKSNADKSLVSHGLPLFQWGNLREKEEPIGRGSFGLVFVARNQHGEKVVIKKLLSEDDHEKRLFIKEAKILHGINNEHIVKFKAACMEPCAMMLEYLFFDFAPFGGSAIVSSLDRLLQHLHMNEAIDQFPFQEKIALETAAGLAHLHDLGIVHRDIKPANVLVSNQHYSTLDDRQELEHAFQTRPIICKLADFGESRSAINQARRHVEEDCKRKLRSLGISAEHCTAFLQDIFGSDVKQEKGLIDSDGCKDFDAKLESLESVWNSRERKSRGTVLSHSSEAEFHKYFMANVAEDMKKKMISPVRKRAGFGESFFYNNGAESKHQRIKARKRQMYGDRKLAWTEVVDLLKSISEEEERNCERAIVDEGPYKIGQPYSSKLQVTFSVYISKSHAQKEKINKRVHELTLEAALLQEGVPVHQAKKNLTECAYKNVPKSVGGKPGDAERKRKRLPQTQRSTSEYRERIATPPKPTLDTTTFKVKWLKNSRVYRCYGCRQNIRPKPQKGEAEVVPPPPWDFVLARLELRPIPNRDGELRMSIKPEPVHYHPKLSCIRNAHGKKYYPSVEVTEADKEAMDDVHLEHLRNEFGI